MTEWGRVAKDVRIVAYVEWIDSGVVAAGWTDIAEIPEAIVSSRSPIRSVGFLFSSDDAGITLLGGLNDTHDEVLSGLWIPRSAIVRIVEWEPEQEATDAREG